MTTAQGLRDSVEYHKMRTIVVIPTYNEADNIEKITSSVLTVQPGVHILVVDDSSPDGTGDIADKLSAASEGRLHVLHRGSKDGLGRAYIAGFDWALSHGYDAMIEMDADLSHDPMFLESIIAAGQDSDVVIGSRYLNGISVINWPLRRILLSLGANQYVRTMIRVPIHDCTSGYRLYRRHVLESIGLDNVRSNGYSFQVEMSFRAHIAGFKIVEVPIIFMERRAGQSKMSKGVIWESIKMPVKLRLRERALRKQLRK
jgi:dolichol-phosphate mannosyltransferase